MYLENKKIRTYFPYNIKCTNEFFRTSSESHKPDFISFIVTIFFCLVNSAVVRQTSRFCILLQKTCQYLLLIQHLLCSYDYTDKITGKSENPFTIRVNDEVFILYICLSFVESLSKLDVIAIILKNAYKDCDYEEIYSRLKSNITIPELMKFLFELRKHNLLMYSESQNNKVIITTKGMQYMQIHEELMNQIYPRNIKRSGIFNRHNRFLKLPNLFKKNGIRSLR